MVDRRAGVVGRCAGGSPGGGEQPFLWGGRGGAFPVGAGEVEERALGVEQWLARVHRHRVDQEALFFSF